MRRYRIEVRGIVQGVGFRPFVYQLAHRFNLNGWVLNSTEGVTIEVEGEDEVLRSFLNALKRERPPLAKVSELRVEELPPAGYKSFEIRRSSSTERRLPVIPPDAAMCEHCLKELYDPNDRRYRYPFINCTYCGPRYSIILQLPYDRPNTTMREFHMCEDCRREYEDPLDRRFHAQPVACPKCGPSLSLLTAGGEVIAEGEEALKLAAECVRRGEILALKGVGGYQLIVDATSSETVAELRRRKRRPTKPFALMMPSLDCVMKYCEVSDAEAELLTSVQAPIVLLRLKDWGDIAEEVAPGSPFLGVMLPYSPLHRLLMDEIGKPVVCTSGNLTEEPICITEEEALNRLKEIAHLFLVNNRRIARHVDDSVALVLKGADELYMIRRARGYAPMPLALPHSVELKPTLAMGSHLKNTVALASDNWVVVSQHVGDLENLATLRAYERTYEDLMRFLGIEPEVIAVDLHPDYHSTILGERLAERFGSKLIRVQHHHAHLASALAEAISKGVIEDLDAYLVGLAWDGTGYGTDGTIWGGEVLKFNLKGFYRLLQLLPFKLPGGDKAIREPWRVALSLLREAVDNWFEVALELKLSAERELSLISRLLESKIPPLTSSMGRLFDGVSALLGIKRSATYEGEPAVALEWLAWRGGSPRDALREAYEPIIYGGVIDWRPLINEILTDLRRGVPLEVIALRFHGWLVKLAIEVRELYQEPYLVISGGCFQNRLLVEALSLAWSEKGLGTLIKHFEYPPNDGGVSLGQALIAGYS